jgi:Pentapeptide repeats (8 copies)
MADEEQLRILKQGVGAWNAWREQDGWETGVDLSLANLRGANLRGADLSGANLSRAELGGVTLNDANLGGDVEGQRRGAVVISGSSLRRNRAALAQPENVRKDVWGRPHRNRAR